MCIRDRLSLKEIKEIRGHIDDRMEIETFVHGAMCISYSGPVSYTHLDVYKRQVLHVTVQATIPRRSERLLRFQPV